MIKNINNILYIMKKTLIFPSYQDIHKLDYLHLIPKDIDIYIYEKKEEDTSYNKIDNISYYYMYSNLRIIQWW